MSLVENTNYISKDDGQTDYGMINQSSELDELASKIRPDVLATASHAHIPRETKTKSRIVDLLSAIAAAYRLAKLSHSAPVFLVQHHYDWEQASGYYFFIGLEHEIKQKLVELSQDRDNLVQNSRWH